MRRVSEEAHMINPITIPITNYSQSWFENGYLTVLLPNGRVAYARGLI